MGRYSLMVRSRRTPVPTSPARGKVEAGVRGSMLPKIGSGTLPLAGRVGEGVGETGSSLTICPYFKLGKVNSAPPLMPAGQREVTVLRRV